MMCSRIETTVRGLGPSKQREASVACFDVPGRNGEFAILRWSLVGATARDAGVKRQHSAA